MIFVPKLQEILTSLCEEAANIKQIHQKEVAYLWGLIEELTKKIKRLQQTKATKNQSKYNPVYEATPNQKQALEIKYKRYNLKDFSSCTNLLLLKQTVVGNIKQKHLNHSNTHRQFYKNTKTQITQSIIKNQNSSHQTKKPIIKNTIFNKKKLFKGKQNNNKIISTKIKRFTDIQQNK